MTADLKQYDIRVLIISNNNPMCVTTSRFLPNDCEIVIPSGQAEWYEENLVNPLILAPDELEKGGQVKNWILNNIEEKTVIMLRDDITDFLRVTDKHSVSIKDKEELLEILLNTAEMARGARAHVFGFGEGRNYTATDPFVLSGVVSDIIGVIGRKRPFYNDPFVDCANYCLESLQKERKVWIDSRYLVKSSNKSPWNAITEENRGSLEWLDYHWGKYVIKKTNNKTGREILECKVPRRQKLEYGIWG